MYFVATFFVIDEISMVGYNMFNAVDQRLRQIMGVNKPFGNLNVITFGDFRQLPPVGDAPIFQIPKNAGLAHIAENILWEKFQLLLNKNELIYIYIYF